MLQRRLGRTGRMVGEIGFGGRALGPDWRGVEAREVVRVLSEAIETGVDLVDTSPGWGDSEALVGEAVRALRARDRVVVATQVPAAPARAGWISANPRLQHVLPAAWVQESVEGSLRNTRLDVLPLVQLTGAMGWNDDWLQQTAWPELRGAMERLVREGKVLHWGVVAPDGTAAPLVVFDEPVIGTVQVGFDLFDRRAERLLAGALKSEIGVIVRSPLCGGALGGELGALTQFPPLDARHRRFPEALRAQIAVRIAELATLVGSVPEAASSSDDARAITEKHARHLASVDDVEIDRVAELALRFVLDRAEVACAVVGMRTTAHLRENLAVSDGRRMSARLVDRLIAHAWDAPG